MASALTRSVGGCDWKWLVEWQYFSILHDRLISALYSWLSALESTKWLQHLSVMLKAAVLVANTVDREGRPVLVHCSDGWDRTPQIVALAKILLDPYYRTLEVLRRGGWGRFWLLGSVLGIF